MSLPITLIREELINELKEKTSIVIKAPPGSGKSTQVPQMILDSGLTQKPIAVLQPRRMAARLLASRVAIERGVALGDEVGYQVRLDKRISAKTQICFFTEGLFMQKVFSGNESQWGAIILDEFHERHVESDLLLAILRKRQHSNSKGDETKLIVMSATLQAEPLCQFLDCRVLEAQGQLHPVSISYHPSKREEKIWHKTSEVVRQLIKVDSKLDNALIFMPGKHEIHQCYESLKDLCSLKGIELEVLHGDLSLKEQERVLKVSKQSRIIITTNIAETSLTIEGISHVIDGGLVRINRFNPSRGINTLKLESIARDSAEQRAGRAGRLGPGHCLRLWSRQDQSMRRASSDPEMQRVELSQILLLLLAGDIDPNTFSWFEAPDESSLKAAHHLLKDLDALGQDGRLSNIGRKMAEWRGTSPRMARLLVEAEEQGCLDEAFIFVGLLEEGCPKLSMDTLRNYGCQEGFYSDLFAYLAWAQGRLSQRHNEESLKRRVLVRAKELKRGKSQSSVRREYEGSAVALIKCLLASHPDRVALKLSAGENRYRLSGGKGGKLDENHPLANETLILSLSLFQTGHSNRQETRLNLICQLKQEWLGEVLPPAPTLIQETQWNPDNLQVEDRDNLVWRDLVLQSTSSPSKNKNKSAEILSRLLLDQKLKLPGEHKEADQWLQRVRCVSQWFPEKELINYDEEDLEVIYQELCHNAVKSDDLKGVNLLDCFRMALSWDEQQFVEKMAPVEIPLKGARKRNLKISYIAGEIPRAAAKIQDFYDFPGHPCVCAGRVKVLLEILAPNFRPAQITDDLPGFWKRSYPQVKKDLFRRYPKHEWR
ncbi:MAG: ATP-dependent helicase HrpB [Planctomycetes bacterium]|nr:ATP-dependent helicase HrpB [Planctomycetota bacterium]